MKGVSAYKSPLRDAASWPWAFELVWPQAGRHGRGRAETLFFPFSPNGFSLMLKTIKIGVLAILAIIV